MNNKKRENIELYAFVGIVALIVFVGYDGFINEDTIQGGSKRTKVVLGKLIMGFIWKLGDDYLWVYILFRGGFLLVALWMGFKIYKAIRNKL